MTGQVYRTAQGKHLDMGALKLKGENERAVGNMKVNARGDVLDSNNDTVVSRADQVRRQYDKQTKVSNIPVSPGRSKK
jgi:hypothetical protein